MFWKHAWAFAHDDPCGLNWHHGPRTPEASHSGGGRHWGHSGFGVRRPLRFIARELDLDEAQVAELAAILDDLKTERAQAKVDHRKAIASFAEIFLAEAFDGERAGEATGARAASAKRLEEAVAKALERTFALLDPGQRKRLAYLLRSGGLTI